MGHGDHESVKAQGHVGGHSVLETLMSKRELMVIGKHGEQTYGPETTSIKSQMWGAGKPEAIIEHKQFLLCSIYFVCNTSSA